MPPDYGILSFQIFLSFLLTKGIWNNSTFTNVRQFKLTRNRICISKLQAGEHPVHFKYRYDSVAPGYTTKCLSLKLFSESSHLFSLPRFSLSIETATIIYVVFTHAVKCINWSRNSVLRVKAESSVELLHFQVCAVLA